MGLVHPPDISPQDWCNSLVFSAIFLIPSIWVNIPESFANIMRSCKPPGLCLCSEWCPHVPIWVATSFSGQDSMFLEKGWQTFLRSRIVQKGYPIIFTYDGHET